MPDDSILGGAPGGEGPPRGGLPAGDRDVGRSLRRFVDRARQRATARWIAMAGLDFVLGAVGLGVAATAATAASLRGDLVARGWIAATAVLGVGLAVRVVARIRRRFGDRQRAARTLATTSGPLSEGASPSRARAERLLRHEVLGALELAEALHDPRDAPAVRSPALVAAYVDDVERRVERPEIDPGLALPRPRSRPRTWSAIALGVALGLGTQWPAAVQAALLVLTATDGRPPRPPEPVWSTLGLELTYPPHTGRPRRSVPNPSGALRVPAGTVVSLDLLARRPAGAGRVLVTYDPTELDDAPEPELVELGSDDTEGVHWTGSFTARGSGTWTLVLLDDDDDDLADASRRSAALPLQLEPDRPPEIELSPLPAAQREVHDNDSVDVRFHARDDFGLASAELVYQLPDGTAHRLPADRPARTTRTWRHRITWDVSQIPIQERSEVLYWVEVRDNDPGLGLDPLPDPPGKLTRSATMRLVIQDDEAEHAANIVRLAEIRDAAVDLLAVRMTTRAFEREPAEPDPAFPPLTVRAAMARDIFSRATEVLAMLATAIDNLSMDTLAHERDVATLTGIHGRLAKLHRTELDLHEALPPGSERLRPAEAASALLALGPHDAKEVRQLEDEIIRLDDLVDGQIIERLEALVARLEATQRKLVELLEQLKAGDESVRAQIDQLEQRRREDLRRIAEARAMLRQEVEQEFMNLDAFEVLERMAEREDLSKMLQRGELDQALEQARGQLDGVRQLRDEVQQRVGAGAPGAEAMSEEERRRMQLLRELSRLQDEEGNLRAQTSQLHDAWRKKVADQEAEPEGRRRASRDVESLRKALEKVNDARLGRDGRRGLEDAKDALDRLEAVAEKEGASQLDLAEAAERVTEHLRQAESGAESREQEGKALQRARERAQGLERALEAPLPSPRQALDGTELEQLDAIRRRQEGLRRRASDLAQSELADPLPGEGRKAMRQADRGMGQSAKELGDQAPRDAIGGQSQAWQGLQEAIDSLRRGSPPPPAASGGDASTEAERDRSLRDALMDAMREGAPEGYDEPVKRYYEELLR